MINLRLEPAASHSEQADVEFLFNGLDVSNAWSLSENDVKFLDNWAAWQPEKE